MLYGIIAAFETRNANERNANETVSEFLNPVFNPPPMRTPERPSSTR